jgi:hypothetical protein
MGVSWPIHQLLWDSIYAWDGEQDTGFIRRSRMEKATAAHRPLEMETASRRQSATTRAWGSIGSAEIFAEGTAYTTTKWDVHHAGLARYRQGVVDG